MNWVAIRMLLGDPAKYLGLVFGIAFATLLIAQQGSIFAGLMQRTASTIYDIRDVNLWVMDSRTEQEDASDPMPSVALQRVRGIKGVEWAVPLLRAPITVKTGEGILKPGRIIGVDDQSLIGLPMQFAIGSADNLRRDNAVVIDEGGYRYIWPGEPFKLGKTFEMNDKRAILVGVVRARKAFTSEMIVYAKYNDALDYSAGGRNRLTFVIGHAAGAERPEAVATRIEAATGYKARSSKQFRGETINFMLATSGITFNFVITIFLGFVVGTAIVGLTFSLFIRDNIKQFGALKAIGVGNRAIVTMVLTQGAFVGLIGYGIGIGMASLFFHFTKNVDALRFYMPWEIGLATGGLMALILLLSGFGSLRRVLNTDPAIVFRG